MTTTPTHRPLVSLLAVVAASTALACAPETPQSDLTGRRENVPPPSPSSSSSEEEPQLPALPAFKSGDALDAAKVGAMSQMVQAMLTGWNYAASTEPKAIALNADGLGFVSVKAGASVDDAKRTALEACFVIGGGKPCSLAVVGDAFVIDANEVGTKDAITSFPAQTATLGPGAPPIPFTTAAATAAALANYAASKSQFKAIAVSLDGTLAGPGVLPPSASAVEASSQQDADRAAVERCELSAAFAPCTLYASGTAVVYDPASPRWAPAIDYARTQLAEGVPLPGMVAGVTDILFQQYVPNVVDNKGAVWLAPSGGGGFSVSSSFDADAKANCEAQVNVTPGTCFRYAIGTQVEMEPTNLAAMSRFDPGMHCRAMPRTSCDAHAVVGCKTNGTYYTTRDGAIALEQCTF